MATTTAEAIRERAIAVIKALVPSSLAGDRFIAYRNEGSADFRAWAQDNAGAAIRHFQVRTTGEDKPVEVSNGDFETHYVRLVVVVAYPQTNRWGAGLALDRDDVMDQDRHQIEHAIGLFGSANFTPATNADATFRESLVAPRESTANVDFLVIAQLMSFYRAMT